MHAVVPVAAANEGVQARKGQVRINSFPNHLLVRLPGSGLYRFNDAVHGAAYCPGVAADDLIAVFAYCFILQIVG